MVERRKKMRKLLLTALITLATPAALMAETIIANVNGMVCGYCAKSIEKTFAKNDAVQSVKVDLDKKVVSIVLKPKATLADSDVTKKISDAGYKVVKIVRVA
jgi:copper chaperone CopZ